ncbi:MAG TPA: prepilin-type N-terminal cleavage/methylation domain-containing protein [Usitatibacteraceae bacterium]|nr:prepilin-type N-terminal cleavage/methylation domain-containing protein [Usitatibacteraceae bacterium]
MNDPRRLRSAGFTLLEMLIGLTLLGVLLVMVYAALSIGVRAWDSGDRRVAEAAHQRIVQSFLRRELDQLFAVRWRGIAESKLAFEGGKEEIRFVTTLNLGAGFKDGGLQWAHLYVAEDGEREGRSRALYIRREPFDLYAKDWDGLSAAKPTRLAESVKSIEIAYFGAESDVTDPKWSDEWKHPSRLPQLIRIRVKSETGRDVPELVVAPKIGEEAGCYDNGFQRQCAPRRA